MTEDFKNPTSHLILSLIFLGLGLVNLHDHWWLWKLVGVGLLYLSIDHLFKWLRNR